MKREIYALTFFAPDVEYYFYPTKRQAENMAPVRYGELVRDYVERGVPEEERWIEYEVTAWEFSPSRQGVADILNRFVVFACLRED